MVELSITGMPEVIWAIRREMADLLRQQAADETPDVKRRMREVADVFEAGATLADSQSVSRRPG